MRLRVDGTLPDKAARELALTGRPVTPDEIIEAIGSGTPEALVADMEPTLVRIDRQFRPATDSQHAAHHAWSAHTTACSGIHRPSHVNSQSVSDYSHLSYNRTQNVALIVRLISTAAICLAVRSRPCRKNSR